MSEDTVDKHSGMTETEVSEMVKGIFNGTYTPSPHPPSTEKPDVPENNEYQAVTSKVVEVQTPNSRTRFHVPNDRVELEREKLESARNERKVQGIKVVLPNSRGMR